jgi:hypothetical protein
MGTSQILYAKLSSPRVKHEIASKAGPNKSTHAIPQFKTSRSVDSFESEPRKVCKCEQTFFLSLPPGRRFTSSCLDAEAPPETQQTSILTEGVLYRRFTSTVPHSPLLRVQQQYVVVLTPKRGDR